MPTYDYLCRECGEKFEHFQSMSSPALRTFPFCKNCKKENCRVERIISGGTGLIFKGSGFYLTDYKNKKSDSKNLNQVILIIKQSRRNQKIVKKEKNLHELVTNYKDGKRCFTCSG